MMIRKMKRRTALPSNQRYQSHCSIQPMIRRNCVDMPGSLMRKITYQYSSIHICKCIIEGSFGVKLPTIWTDGKAEVGRVREEKGRRNKQKEDQRKERVKRKKMHAFSCSLELIIIFVFFFLTVAAVSKARPDLLDILALKS